MKYGIVATLQIALDMRRYATQARRAMEDFIGMPGPWEAVTDEEYEKLKQAQTLLMEVHQAVIERASEFEHACRKEVNHLEEVAAVESPTGDEDVVQ